MTWCSAGFLCLSARSALTDLRSRAMDQIPICRTPRASRLRVPPQFVLSPLTEGP